MQSALQLGVVRTYGPRAAQAPGKHSGGVEHGSLQPGCVVVLPGCIRIRGLSAPFKDAPGSAHALASAAGGHVIINSATHCCSKAAERTGIQVLDQLRDRVNRAVALPVACEAGGRRAARSRRSLCSGVAVACGRRHLRHRAPDRAQSRCPRPLGGHTNVSAAQTRRAPGGSPPMKNLPLPRATIVIRRCARDAAGLRAACSWTRWCSRLVDANIAAACCCEAMQAVWKRAMGACWSGLGSGLLRAQHGPCHEQPKAKVACSPPPAFNRAIWRLQFTCNGVCGRMTAHRAGATPQGALPPPPPAGHPAAAAASTAASTLRQEVAGGGAQPALLLQPLGQGLGAVVVRRQALLNLLPRHQQVGGGVLPRPNTRLTPATTRQEGGNRG